MSSLNALSLQVFLLQQVTLCDVDIIAVHKESMLAQVHHIAGRQYNPIDRGPLPDLCSSPWVLLITITLQRFGRGVNHCLNQPV